MSQDSTKDRQADEQDNEPDEVVTLPVYSYPRERSSFPV